jgi:16S rRNA (guanine(1405)-N(7))-methyltransferase
MDDPLVDRVQAGPKYRGLDPAFVARILAEVRPTVRSDAEAVKVAKRRLHQAFGAFTGGRPVAALARLREALAADPGDREALVAAMRAHASTAERVAHLDAFAALLASWVGRPASVIDLACGLGPLATPWLDLAAGCRYWCCDVDRAMVDGLRAVAPYLPVDLTAETVDLVDRTVTAPADVALALKVVTTLDQQRPGRSAEVLGALRCPDVVASVPTGSLGGGRRYTDPLDQVARLAATAGLEVVADRAIGVEHYVHLRPSVGR